jgi:hypothetical protein
MINNGMFQIFEEMLRLQTLIVEASCQTLAVPSSLALTSHGSVEWKQTERTPSTCERNNAAERQLGAEAVADAPPAAADGAPGATIEPLRSTLDETALTTAAESVVDEIKKLSSDRVSGLI